MSMACLLTTICQNSHWSRRHVNKLFFFFWHRKKNRQRHVYYFWVVFFSVMMTSLRSQLMMFFTSSFSLPPFLLPLSFFSLALSCLFIFIILPFLFSRILCASIIWIFLFNMLVTIALYVFHYSSSLRFPFSISYHF